MTLIPYASLWWNLGPELAHRSGIRKKQAWANYLTTAQHLLVKKLENVQHDWRPAAKAITDVHEAGNPLRPQRCAVQTLHTQYSRTNGSVVSLATRQAST